MSRTPATEAAVKKFYRDEYVKTRSTAAAHNAVLDKFCEPYKPNASKASLARRQHVVELLRGMDDKVVTPALRKKAGVGTITLNVHTLDVLGNKKDGWQINDVYGSGGSIEIPKDGGDRAVFDALKAKGFIDRNVHFKSFSMEGSTVYDRLGKPAYQLRSEHGDWPE